VIVLPTQTTVQIPEEVQEELTNLRGFRDLVAERTGYMLGRKAKQAEMNEATKKERKKANEIRKTIRENIPQWIADANVEEYEKQTKALADASKVVSEKSKPYREVINPLTKAIKFIDTVAVPESLKLLGVQPQPRFSLSDFIQAELEKQKKR